MAKLDLEQAKEEVLRNETNEPLIKNIANLKLKKDWKWSIADQLLSDFNYNIFLKYLDIPHPVTHKFTEKGKKRIIDFFANYTFDKFDFGSKRHINYGENLPLFINNGDLVSEEPFQMGRWTNTTRKPCFSVLFHRTERKILYRLPWMEKPEVINIINDTSENLELELNYKLTGQEKFLYKYRVSAIKFPNDIITFNYEEHAFEHKHYGLYHVHSVWVNDEEYQTIKTNILHAFQQRKALHKEQKLKEEALNNADKVFVSYKDSINAGNCKVRTKIWAKEEQQNYDYPIDIENININGAVLLNKSSSSYVKRAIVKAYNRVFG